MLVYNRQNLVSVFRNVPGVAQQDVVDTLAEQGTGNGIGVGGLAGSLQQVADPAECRRWITEDDQQIGKKVRGLLSKYKRAVIPRWIGTEELNGTFSVLTRSQELSSAGPNPKLI